MSRRIMPPLPGGGRVPRSTKKVKGKVVVKKRISVIGAPLWQGQAHSGVQFGPDALRAVGLVKVLRSLGADVIDEGNIGSGQLKLCPHGEILDGVECLSDKVVEVMSGGRIPLILGGDHSVTLGSMGGLARHCVNPGVIRFDAHAGVNMVRPASAKCRYKVKPENAVFIGTRDIDPGEGDYLRNKGVKVFTAEEVMCTGIETVVHEALAWLKAKCGGIHLSFDMDVIVPDEAYQTGQVVCGLDLGSALEAMRLFSRSRIITSADFVEINPLVDKGGHTALAATALMKVLLRDAKMPAGLNMAV